MLDIGLYVFSLLVAVAIGYFLGRSPAAPKRDVQDIASPAAGDAAEPPQIADDVPPLPSSDPEEAARRERLSEAVGSRVRLSLADSDEDVAPTRRRVILVSYKLPVSLARDASGNWSFVGWDDIRSYLSNLRLLRNGVVNEGGEELPPMDVTWVGYPGVLVPEAEQDQVEELLAEHNCVPVFLPEDLHKRYFFGFCQTILWPLLHYVSPHFNPVFGDAWENLWQAYGAANMMYAQAVSRVVDSAHDYVWIHHYRLFVLPSFLRKKKSAFRAKIGLFVHTPFPTSEVFRTLPCRENMLRSMLCVDLIGFHTFDYTRHFLSSVKRVLDLDNETSSNGSMVIKYSGRAVVVRISHVGIDATEFEKLVVSDPVKQRAAEFAQRFSKRKVLIGVDDFDLMKGTVLKLHAFSRFLQLYPEQKDEVVLVEVIVPSRGPLQERKSARDNIMHEVEHIRKLYGSACLEIIERDAIELNEIVALYSIAHAAVVSNFWDGLNLMPYEYTACQARREVPGALALSEFMGCSLFLTSAARINPWDVAEVAEAFHKVVTLSDNERKVNFQRRYTYVKKHTVARWAAGFLDELDHAYHMADDLDFVQVGWGSNVQLVGLRNDFVHLDVCNVLPSYLHAARRLLVFDYDGTLTAVTDRHESLCAPRPELLRALQNVTADPNNAVFIVTGRRRTILDQWFSGVERLGLAAEKGAFIRWPGTTEWETTLEGHDFAWKPSALSIMKKYAERLDGAYIEPKEASLVWHFEHTEVEYGRMQAVELVKYLENAVARPDVEILRYDYSRIIEVRPRGTSKAFAIKRIMEKVLGDGGVPTALRAAAAAAASAGTSSLTVNAPHHRHRHSSDDALTITTASSENPFIIVVGDDKSDEEMFRYLQSSLFADSPPGTPAKSVGGFGSPWNASSTLQQRVPRSSVGARRISNDTIATRHTIHNARHSFTVCVGIKPSTAHYFLQDPTEVVQLLQAMGSATVKALKRTASTGSGQGESPSMKTMHQIE